MVPDRSRRIHDHYRKLFTCEFNRHLLSQELRALVRALHILFTDRRSPSSPTPFGGIPMQPTVLVYTARSTPALLAASSTFRVPSTFERYNSSGSFAHRR